MNNEVIFIDVHIIIQNYITIFIIKLDLFGTLYKSIFRVNIYYIFFCLLIRRTGNCNFYI